jgi:hypothetical protein
MGWSRRAIYARDINGCNSDHPLFRAHVPQSRGRARGRRGAPARGSALRPGVCARGSPAARLAWSRACVAGGSGHASRARDAPWWTVDVEVAST